MSESREKILSAASELFLAGGVSALSVRAIAKRAGLSTIGIYSNFQGKQGILDTLYIEGFERVQKAMEKASARGSRREKVMAATRGYLEVAESHGAHYRLIFGESLEGYQPSESAETAARRAFEQLMEIVAQFMDLSASKVDKQNAALEVWALVHGFVSLRNQPVSKIMSTEDWNAITLRAVEKHLDVLSL